MRTTTLTALVALSGMACGVAMGQDSVGPGNGVAGGDALNPFALTEQCNNYVADLAPVTTSWGNTFGVVPVLKANKTNPAFFNALLSASAISPDLRRNVAPASASYSVWNSAGPGINGSVNTAPNTVNAPASVNRLSLGFNEFDSGYEGVVGALVQYSPDEPNRLYVNRRQLAVNAPALGSTLAAIGGLSMDANGNFYVRADEFGVAGANALTGDNWYRIRLLDRSCNGLNVLSNAGPEAASTNWIVVNSATTISPANNIPASVAGGNGIIAGPNFNNQYGFGVNAAAFTNAHLAAPDHRGSIGGTGRFLLSANSTYTFGILSKDATTRTRALNLWGVTNTGTVVAGTPVNLAAPFAVTDASDGFALNYVLGTEEFGAYRSQTFARGGVGMVALGADQGGRGLAASNMYNNGFASDTEVAILAARFNPANPAGSVQWGVVAYVTGFDASGAGKAILDGSGNAIGKLTPLAAVTGGSPFGPSMSIPSFDSVGNAWFISAVELFDRIDTDNDGIGDASDFDSALIRAVYDGTNAAAPEWTLELVLELGTVIDGENSGLPYQISFLGVADSDSIDSGTMFSHSTNQQSWNAVPTASLSTEDTRTNGGVVVRADIVYDRDQDGDFSDPTSAGGDPASGDQSYNALLYVGYYEAEVDPCTVADLTGDGQVDSGDLSTFIVAFLGQNPQADLTGDGQVDSGDLSLFITLFLQCS
jgi:hypothetical protein